MEDVINLFIAVVTYLVVCIIIGGFCFGSIVWLLALFFNVGWGYMAVVSVATVVYFILNSLILLVQA